MGSKSKSILSILFVSFIAIIPFQNCSKVQMRDVDLMNKATGGVDGLGGPLQSDPSGGSNTPIGSGSSSGTPGSPSGTPGSPGSVSGTPGTPGSPSGMPGTPGSPSGMPGTPGSPSGTPGMPGSPSGSGPSAGGGQTTTPGVGPMPPLLPGEIEAKDWLNANCDESSLSQSPLSISFAASGGSAQVRGINEGSIEISDKKSVEAAQLSVKTLSIQKTEQLEIQQVRAEKINIEALQINKIQQISADEINVRANIISGAFQQIDTCSSSGPKLRLQAGIVNEVQQLTALCLRTNSAKKIQQISFAKVIGDAENAKIGEIQQVRELLVINAEVRLIQQVDILILKNTKVKKVQQVRKLILINSSVEETSQVSEISEQ